MDPAVTRPARASSSPRITRNRAFTVSPRVFLGSNATLIPFAKVYRVVRFSMFDGEGSNASPAAAASRPVYPPRAAARSGRSGTSARSGSVVG